MQQPVTSCLLFARAFAFQHDTNRANPSSSTHLADDDPGEALPQLRAPSTSLASRAPSIHTTAFPSRASAPASSSVRPSARASRREIGVVMFGAATLGCAAGGKRDDHHQRGAMTSHCGLLVRADDTA